MIQSTDNRTLEIIEAHRDIIINLARLGTLTVHRTAKRPKSSATAVVDGATIFVSLEGIIDFSKEAERLEKEIKKLSAELTAVANKLGNEGFLNKAPAQVVEKVREKQTILLEMQQKLQKNLDRIKAAEA